MTRIDPAQPALKTTPPLSIVAACVAGNALEFYDFISYAFFAVAIGNTFFPATTPLNSLLLSLGVFGVGFLARPLGGALIGAYADRAGRKPAMLLTIALITFGTLGLALTPSFERIGLAAPILVVACRLVQGLALGGEVGPASAFLVEIAPAGRRGFFTSWQGASQGRGGADGGPRRSGADGGARPGGHAVLGLAFGVSGGAADRAARDVPAAGDARNPAQHADCR